MKKLLVLLLSLCMVFALVACGDSGGDVENSQPPAEAKYLTQVVTLNVFGTDVDVTFVQDAAGTQYSFSYFFANNNIEASGKIENGVYTLTEDPSGFACEIELEVYAALTSTWTGDNEQTITKEPFAAPEKKVESAAKYQVVTVEMFGDKIPVTMTLAPNGADFTMEYEAMGQKIVAYGKVADGTYTVTEDPSGYAAKMITNVTPLLTDVWTPVGEEAPVVGGDEPSVEPASEYAKYQVVTVELFGDKIDVTVSVDAAETVFGMEYAAMGNQITASGTIADGVYTVTEDPSGFAGQMIGNVTPLLTGEWTAIGGEVAAEGYTKYQVVTVDLFGDKIDVTISVDAAETVFGMEYVALGNQITASGAIAGGVYTITEDPSGFAGQMIGNVTPLLTSEWVEK